MSLTPSLDPDPESDLDPDLDPESDLAAPGRPTNHLSIKTLIRKNKQTKVNFHSSVNQNIKQEKQTNKSEFSFICQSCSRV